MYGLLDLVKNWEIGLIGKIELKRYETKEAQAKSPWGIIKYHEKLSYITHGILAKKI